MWFSPLLAGAAALAGGGTITRPNSDVVVTGWTASTGTVLYDMIDEASASDADYIISPGLSSPAPAVFGLNASLASGTYDVRVRARRTASSGEIRVLLQDSGGTTVGTSGWQSLSGSFATYVLNVTTTGSAARARIEVQ